MAARGIDPRWESNQEVFRAAGSGDDLVNKLAGIIESGDWREFTHPMRGVLRFDRLADYCEQFLKLRPEAVRAICKRSTLPQAAGVIVGMLEDVPPAAKQGRPEKNVDSINISQKGGSDPSYLLARLKRDRPDLAAKVVAGELSAHAAAVEAGFRKRYLQVPADDLQAALAKIAEHYGVTLHA